MTEAHAIQTRPARPIDTLRGLLERSRESMAMVLPRHLTPDRMVKLALVAASRNPALLQADPKTVLQAVMQAAQLGLDCSGTLGSAYLVPYGRTCQLIVGYRGLIDLARRSGEIAAIRANVVHERDEFVYEDGLVQVLRHKPMLTVDPGQVVLVYAVATLRDGTTQVEVMTRAQVDAIRARSRAGQSGPWVTDYAEMARKTVVRRLCKYLPLSVELQDALALDEAAETGQPVAIDVSHVEVAEDEPSPPKRTRRLAKQVATDAEASAAAERDRDDPARRIRLSESAADYDASMAQLDSASDLPDLSDHIHDAGDPTDGERQLELTGA